MPAKKSDRNLRPEIPRKTVYRLSIYMRCLQRLLDNGIKMVSSDALAGAAGVKAPQLREDVAYFGQFGTRGLGYDVEQLIQMITDLLGTNHLQPVVLVGVGNLGTALLSYRGFEKEGFGVVAAFDVVVDKKRNKRVKQPVHHMDQLAEFVPERDVRMAILCVPPDRKSVV